MPTKKKETKPKVAKEQSKITKARLKLAEKHRELDQKEAELDLHRKDRALEVIKNQTKVAELCAEVGHDPMKALIRLALSSDLSSADEMRLNFKCFLIMMMGNYLQLLINYLNQVILHTTCLVLKQYMIMIIKVINSLHLLLQRRLNNV